MNLNSHALGATDCTDAQGLAQSPAQDAAQAAQLTAQDSAQAAQLLPFVEGELVEDPASPSGILHPAPYSSKELADELGIAESTLRTRWLPWVNRVAPPELLLADGGYTELARSLFTEFAQVPSRKAEREKWVKAAKDRYTQEFMPGGLVGEGVPEDLGGALALVRSQGNAMQLAADTQLADLLNLIQHQAQVETEFDDAEIAAMRAAGAKRGVMRFQIETETEDAAYYQLRKARSQARQQSPGQPNPGGQS